MAWRRARQSQTESMKLLDWEEVSGLLGEVGRAGVARRHWCVGGKVEAHEGQQLFPTVLKVFQYPSPGLPSWCKGAANQTHPPHELSIMK